MSGYIQMMYTPNVKRAQERFGVRSRAERMESTGRQNSFLGPAEEAFIQDRDSFYMASVNQEGWPYLQHRGGPKGFLRILDERTLAFADYRGNLQLLTTGNLSGDDRVSLSKKPSMKGAAPTAKATGVTARIRQENFPLRHARPRSRKKTCARNAPETGWRFAATPRAPNRIRAYPGDRPRSR